MSPGDGNDDRKKSDYQCPAIMIENLKTPDIPHYRQEIKGFLRSTKGRNCVSKKWGNSPLFDQLIPRFRFRSAIIALT